MNTPNIPHIPETTTTPKEGFRAFLQDYFDLKREKENEYQTIELLKADVDFRGPRVWILICAIFIASLGLNVNSIAVIIGAMLISPLMGPIIGLGLGLGTTDFALVRRSLKSFAMATVIAVITSTVYFFLSPISTAQSELLARTQPTLYDVLIAFFGGLAGVIAGSTKYKGNVIPGVAIATALMPPLCTAGYGIASGQPSFILGAFYLYIINTVFIGLSTFMMIKLLRFPQKSFVDTAKAKRLHASVLFIVLCTVIPSVILAYQLIQNTYFDQQERAFMEKEFNFPNTQIIRHRVHHQGKQRVIEVTLLGEELPASVLQSLSDKLAQYGLENAVLHVRQGFGNNKLEELRENILDNVKNSSLQFIQYQQHQIDSLRQTLQKQEHLQGKATEVASLIAELFPEITRTELGKSYGVVTQTQQIDTLYTISLYSEHKLANNTQQRIEGWLHKRFPNASIHFNTQKK